MRGGYGAAGERHAHRAALTVHLLREFDDRGEVTPLFRRGSDDLLEQHGETDSAATGRVQGVLHGDVVVHGDAADLDALHGGELGGHLEVEHVAGVVLDDVEHARTAVDGLGGDLDAVGSRRGEDFAGDGGVEHSGADEAAVQRLVTGPATRDDRDLALRLRRGTGDDVVLQIDRELRVSERHPLQGLDENVLGGVDELLHRSISFDPS